MTIINEIPIMTEPSWLNFLFIMLPIMFLVFFLLTTLCCNTRVLGNIFLACFIVSGLLWTSCIVAYASQAFDVPTERYRYECTFDENVSIVEIYDNYNVIEQRGNIWVIEDKEID